MPRRPNWSESRANPGRWWRFTRYEITDGLIQPAACGAKLEQYQLRDSEGQITDGSRRRRKAPLQPPHVAVLELAHDLAKETQLTAATETGFTVSSKGCAAITRWCSDYGLLGLLPHRVQMVVLAPKRDVHLISRRERRSVPVPHQRCYVRGPRSWQETGETWFDSSRLAVQARQPEEGALIVDECPLGSPRVLIRDLLAPELRDEPLSATWALHFPAVPKSEAGTFAYPMPLSEEFWAAYAEPVDDFVRALVALREAANLIAGHREATDDSSLAQLDAGMRMLDALMSPTASALVRHEGRPRMTTFSGSLLAAIALRLAEEAAAERIIACPNCAKSFVALSLRAIYCSPRCSQTARTREYRRRKTKSTRRRKKDA